MVDPVSLVGLVSLFSVCLEGYRICLAIQTADEDVRILRARMFYQKERFQNVGKMCGLIPSNTKDGQTEALNKFLQEDRLRQRAIAETLELIAGLLGKAEELDHKYEARQELPDVLKERSPAAAVSSAYRQIRASLRKATWSIRDKAAYKELLENLAAFNTALETSLPGQLQRFLESVLPATLSAADSNNELSDMVDLSTHHAFLTSQVRWVSAVQESEATFEGAQLQENHFERWDQVQSQSRYIVRRSAEQPKVYYLVDWGRWESTHTDKQRNISSVAGLLKNDTCDELRLLPCLGYLMEHDRRMETTRFALVYKSASAQPKFQSLLQLLSTFKTIQLPPLETRVALARTLCRAMMLYHSSGWIHHDFRSHNILFMKADILSDTVTAGIEYQGMAFDRPYVVGFGHARGEDALSTMFMDSSAIAKTLKLQRLYWSPSYLSSSRELQTNKSFLRSHDIYSLGCVFLEIGVWKPLEKYTWESTYDKDHRKWHERLLKEEGKLRALCGSRYAEAVLQCLNWRSSDVETDVQALAFSILLKLEEITV